MLKIKLIPMKKLIILVMVIVIALTTQGQDSLKCPRYVCVEPAARPGSIEELWEKEMVRYMKIIVDKFGLPFDSTWQPRVSFVETQYYAAQYNQVSKSFTITKWYRPVLPRDSGSNFVANLVSHELGNALAEQRAYSKFCKMWPDTMVWKYGSERQRFAQKILSEGVAEYFGYLVTGGLKTDSLYRHLPNKERNCVWNPSLWMYNGGYWTVKPILDTFGIRGLDYIIRNTKFPGIDYNLRKWAKKYQEKAFKELSQ